MNKRYYYFSIDHTTEAIVFVPIKPLRIANYKNITSSNYYSFKLLVY